MVRIILRTITIKTLTLIWFTILCGFLIQDNIENILLRTEQMDTKYTPCAAELQTLSYNKFKSVNFTASDCDRIFWSFSSSNEYVGITVRAMNMGNYSLFTRAQVYHYYSLSPGSFISDSGEFRTEYPDIWYIVYINYHPVHQTTILTYSVDITPNYYCSIITEDSYEPNNSFGEAKSISVGFYGSLTSSDQDYFKIFVYEGNILSIQVNWIESASDLDLYLYNSTYNQIICTNGVNRPEVLTCQVTKSGYYYVVVIKKSGSDTTYTMVVSKNTSSSPSSSSSSSIAGSESNNNAVSIGVQSLLWSSVTFIFGFCCCLCYYRVRRLTRSSKNKSPSDSPHSSPLSPAPTIQPSSPQEHNSYNAESEIKPHCSSCGNPYESKAKYCANCGIPLT